MPVAGNRLVWEGRPGHYEVYYLTLTDPGSGVGVWIRYTILAPAGDGRPSAALWFAAMDPRPDRPTTFARKVAVAIEAVQAGHAPFSISFGDAVLREDGMTGSIAEASWDLRWAPSALSLEHVHPLLRSARVAQTTLALPQADLQIDGTIAFADERLELEGARGAQAHLWGSKHARSWAWVHCNDLVHQDGSAAGGDVIDAVSVVVERMGRELGPSTPVVGRIDGERFISRSPWRVMTNPSVYGLTGWRFQAVDGARKLIVEVDAERDQLAGVTYQDPDGEHAYCYNSETASVRLHVLHRSRQVGGWRLSESLRAPGRAHFEYGQRRPIPDLELLIR